MLQKDMGCKQSLGTNGQKIATYLPGRTDNDVKNFWSSKRKRLARIPHTSTTPSKSHKNKKELPHVEVPKAEGESSCSSTCIVDSVDEMNMVPLPELKEDSELLALEAIPLQHHPPPSEEKYLWIQADLDFSSETQQLLRGDPYLDMFGTLAAKLAVEPPLLGCGNVFGNENTENALIPDCLFNDFPSQGRSHLKPTSVN